MPTSQQYDTIKQQCNAMREIGCMVNFEMQPRDRDAAPKIQIGRNGKLYHFCDPDWNVAIAQIAQLYKIMRK